MKDIDREDEIYSAGCCVVPVAQFPDKLTKAEVMTIKESCYRRGFTQGVAAALRAMEAGKGDEIEDWLYELMTKWRSARHHGKQTRPKELV
jgi:hypothetical protein